MNGGVDIYRVVARSDGHVDECLPAQLTLPVPPPVLLLGCCKRRDGEMRFSHLLKCLNGDVPIRILGGFLGNYVGFSRRTTHDPIARSLARSPDSKLFNPKVARS